MTRILVPAVLVIAAMFATRSVQDPDMPVFSQGDPIFLSWSAPEGEVAADLIRYEVMKTWMQWTKADVVVPSPTHEYRWQLPPDVLWVDTFLLGLRGCTKWECTAVTWQWFKVIPAVEGLPTLPRDLRLVPNMPLVRRPGA